MKQANSTINWENGCQQEMEQEIGVFVGEQQEMVGIFHSNCDGKKPTLTIVQVIKNKKTYVFGGYATKIWEDPSGSAYGEFEIFTLSHLFFLLSPFICTTFK